MKNKCFDIGTRLKSVSELKIGQTRRYRERLLSGAAIAVWQQNIRTTPGPGKPTVLKQSTARDPRASGIAAAGGGRDGGYRSQVRETDATRLHHNQDSVFHFERIPPESVTWGAFPLVRLSVRYSLQSLFRHVALSDYQFSFKVPRYR